MYQVKFNDYILYDPRSDELTIREPSLRLAAGETGSFSFIIDNDHPSAAQLTKLLGDVEVLQDGETVYRGRIIRDEKDFYNSRRVETEGLLAACNDSVIPPFTFPDDLLGRSDYQTAAAGGNVVAFFLGWILDQHNSQVTADRQVKLGTVTVTDSNNYIARSCTDYLSAWEIIKTRLPDSTLGGYLLPRYEADGVYLDYLADFTQANAQTVEFGENLLDITSEVDASEVYTAILPLGADGLTIESLPDGPIGTDLVKEGLTIYSTAARQKYGRITKAVSWDDVTIDTNLQTKAAAELESAGVLMTNSLTVTACDLHCDDSTIASFRVGRYVTIQSSPHGLSQSLALVALEPDIMDPGNTQITLGATVQTGTDYNQSTKASAAQKIEQQTIRTDESIAEIRASTTQQIAESAQSTKSEIYGTLGGYVQAGTFADYQEAVSDTFADVASSISEQAENTAEEIARVDTSIAGVSGSVEGLQTQLGGITTTIHTTADKTGLGVGQEATESNAVNVGLMTRFHNGLQIDSPTTTTTVSITAGGNAIAGGCWTKKDVAGLVELQLRFSCTKAATDKTIASLPAELTPAAEIFCSCYNTATKQTGHAWITTAGDVSATLPAAGQTIIRATYHTD